MVESRHRYLRDLLLAVYLLVCPLALVQGQTVELEPTAKLNEASLQLIYDFEVGGGESYYNKFLVRPEWPGAASGVTIGVGYDLGYNSKEVIHKDWRALDEPITLRLSTAAGITGSRAHDILYRYRDIHIEWDEADAVFQDVTLSRFYELTRRTFPGFDKLRPNAKGALVSLVFNRGSSMAGDSRREMRKIRDLVPGLEYSAIAGQIRLMERLWRGKDVGAGLIRRREAEAKLVETP